MPRTRLAVVLGTRPEIIKLAPILAEARRRGIVCRLIHTGQHYDDCLDGALFRELGLPVPSVNLRIGSAARRIQVARMTVAIERALCRERPDWVVVQGDTNSTLAGALAARRAGVPLAHVEAGLRSGDLGMPEERNRIAVDRLADLLFAPTELQGRDLRARGRRPDTIRVVGNTIADAVAAHGPGAGESAAIARRFGLDPRRYALMTVHRTANVDSTARLRRILRGVADSARIDDLRVVLPLHPRLRERLRRDHIGVPAAVRCIDPIGFRDCVGLQSSARLVMTDSGGLQEEACILGVPCVTLRENTERPETVAIGANRLAGSRARKGNWRVPKAFRRSPAR